MAGREEEDDVRSITKDLPSSVNLKTTVLNRFKEEGIVDKDGKFHPHFQTPTGVFELAKTSFDTYGHHRDYGKVFSEIASDASKKGPLGLSAQNIALMSIYGSSAMGAGGQTALELAKVKSKLPKWAGGGGYVPDYVPGIKQITQGYYTDASGQQQPISNQGIEPTKIPGTDISVNTSLLGILNDQAASGPISAHGGQPYHHISGLLDVAKNIPDITDPDVKPGIFNLMGAIMRSVRGRRAIPQVVEKVTKGIDKKDKLASVWT